MPAYKYDHDCYCCVATVVIALSVWKLVYVCVLIHDVCFALYKCVWADVDLSMFLHTCEKF